MELFWRDIRYSVRLAFRNPASIAIAVLTLALGIGAVTAIASVVNSVILRPLPCDNPTSWWWSPIPRKAKKSIPMQFLSNAVCLVMRLV